MTRLRFTTDGVAQVTQAQERIADGTQKQADEVERLTRTQGELGRITNKVNRDNEDAQRRLARLIDEVNDAHKNGRLSTDQQKEAIGRLNKEFENSTGQFAKFKEQSEQSFGASAVRRLATFAAGFVSLGTAVAVVTNELRSQQELIDKQQQAALTVGESRDVVIRNLVGVDVGETRDILGENRALADRLQISEKFINLARAEALSSTGGDRLTSLQTVDVAARFLRSSPEAIGAFAGSLADVAKVTGSDDAITNLGLLTSVAGLSRVADPQQQAANIPRALIGVTGFGGSAQEAAALFATLTTAGGDLTGARGGTGAIALARQLQEFEGLQGGFGQRLQALQQNPELARRFLDESSFEQIVQAPIRDLLLDASSFAAQEFAKNLETISGTDLAVSGQERLSSFAANTLRSAERRRSALESNAERKRLRDAQAGFLDETERNLVKEILQREGATSLGAKASIVLQDLQDFSVGITSQDVISILENEERANRNPTRLGLQRGPLGPTLENIPRQPTPEELKAAESLNEMIAVLREILAENQTTNRTLETSEGGLAVGTE